MADKPVAALDEAAIAAFAAEMIAIPTESPPGGEYPACVARVTDELARLGLDYQLLEFLSVLQAVRRRRIDLDWEVLQSAPCSLTPADAPFVQTVVAAAKRVTGATPPLTCCPGFLETRAYTALGVPAVACGPELMDQMHGPAEYVAVANLSAAAAIYVDTARALDAAREGLCAEMIWNVRDTEQPLQASLGRALVLAVAFIAGAPRRFASMKGCNAEVAR